MTDRPQILLAHHLKTLKPTFLREYEKVARKCAAEGLDSSWPGWWSWN